MFRHREYKSGSDWAFWRWTFTPSGYITRLHVFKTPWFAIMVHKFNKPDQEPDQHDHPVTFLSLILRGKYTEIRNGVKQVRKWFNFIRADKTDRHRIIDVDEGTTTLCFVGKKTREWGFHTSEGWVYWKDYNKKYR